LGAEATIPDSGLARLDQGLRREVKYVFTNQDVAALRTVLMQSCRPIAYAGPVSTVRSLYFDDQALNACRASIDGTGVRHKTRIRWYDAELPTDHLYFEVKWRRYRFCGKDRLRVPCPSGLGGGPLRTIRQHLRDRLPDRYTHILATESDPVVLVEYRREHFELASGEARLTLDYDLRFCPHMGARRISSRFPDRLAGVVLIECKAEVDDGPGLAALHRVLRTLSVRPARFSKYVTACERLGYATQ
jgi:hypothetical protein